MSQATIHAVPPLLGADALANTQDVLLDDTLDDKKEIELTGIKAVVAHAVVDKEYEAPPVDRKELWSYYLYYNVDNGVANNGYCPAQMQNLTTQSGYEKSLGPGNPCSASSATCMVNAFGKTRSVSSTVLVANGISFAVMTFLFTTLGSAADYRQFARWWLLALTLVCWISAMLFLICKDASYYMTSIGLYMVGYISYGATLVFYAMLFPRLARNTPTTRKLLAQREAGEIQEEEYQKAEMLERNRISNISTAHSNIGYLLTLCLNLSLLLPMSNNAQVNNYVIALTTFYWIVLGIPWFIFQKKRMGPSLPKGTSYLTIGWIQIWQAVKQFRQLPYTFIYLAAFFFLADGLNTTGTLVSICQNDAISFSFLDYTYLGLSQAATSIMSTLGFWYFQRYFKMKTKVFFVFVTCFTVLLSFWGMIGIWTTKIDHKWEFWLYNILFGLFQAPYYAYSQTMLSDLSPPQYEGLFFGLFGITNRASSIIGPNVVSAIVNRSGSNQTGFAFLFAICTVALLMIIFCIDMDKGHADAVAWSENRRAKEAAESHHKET